MGEIIEGNYEISTLYQLVLALVMARQSSVVIKAVRDIISKVEFMEKLRTLRGLDIVPDSKAMVAYCLEDLFTSLPAFLGNPSYITVELAQTFIHYRLLETLATIIVSWSKQQLL